MASVEASLLLRTLAIVFACPRYGTWPEPVFVDDSGQQIGIPAGASGVGIGQSPSRLGKLGIASNVVRVGAGIGHEHDGQVGQGPDRGNHIVAEFRNAGVHDDDVLAADLNRDVVALARRGSIRCLARATRGLSSCRSSVPARARAGVVMSSRVTQISIIASGSIAAICRKPIETISRSLRPLGRRYLRLVRSQLASFFWYSGYMVSAPPRVASCGIPTLSANSYNHGFCPGRWYGTQPFSCSTSDAGNAEIGKVKLLSRLDPIGRPD